jgi:hypothetical protein
MNTTDIATSSERPAPDTMLALIARAASDPSIDLDKMERLLVMKERMDEKVSEQSFNDAMNAAQAEIRAIGWNKTNKQTSSSYVTYDKLDAYIRPVYVRHGFALSFDTGDARVTEEVRFICYVSHRDGHTRTYKVDMPADGKGAKGNDVMTKTHALGSATSYGRRYLLKMIFNVIEAAEDDDGNNASGTVCVSDAQAATIRDILEDNDFDIRAFCDYFKVDAITSIPANRFDGVMRDIKQKIAAKERKHGAA